MPLRDDVHNAAVPSVVSNMRSLIGIHELGLLPDVHVYLYFG